METITARECITTADEPPPTIAVDSPRSVPTSLLVPGANSRWNDWRWQIRNRIRTYEELRRTLPAVESIPEIDQVAAKYPLAITPYYASLIRRADCSDPIYHMAVPQIQELHDPSFLHADPLEEEHDMPVPGLVHRYRDRALLIATTMCAMYCRHCTRKRVAGTKESSISICRLRQVSEYLTAHPEITDVIISGGDPLTMPTALLERVLSAVRSVPSVEIIRIGTRAPVVLPQRITDELVQMLRKYHPVWINTHFNHPSELTEESISALARLADAGIPLGNQSVLLRGINDDPRVMESLCRALVRARVRPYYLFQCDLVRGIEHFRTPLSRGIEIMEYLRGRLSGLAIPTFVVDTPHGGGKIPLLPNYILSTSPSHTVLRNFEGMMVNYPEPLTLPPERIREAAPDSTGVWELASGKASVIVPQNSGRARRRKSHSGLRPVERFLPD
jgi:lysine 2,3-aminomutase